ncbi:hypothetical protein F4777DRAFT_178156 [Nemania sp. FL0916]|nr:hypothetical protein F4777DRAFT_178156 [Nemania sp. FL0916]
MRAPPVDLPDPEINVDPAINVNPLNRIFLPPRPRMRMRRRPLIESGETFPRPKRPKPPDPCCLYDPMILVPGPADEFVSLIGDLVIEGGTILQLGSRIGDVTCELAKLVGSNGSVTAIIPPGADLQLYRYHARFHNLTNIRFVEIDDYLHLPFGQGSFDIVYACDLMARLPPMFGRTGVKHLLREMKRVTKINGLVASRDIAAQHFFPNSDIGSMLTNTLFKSAGIKEWFGACMPQLFEAAGFDPHESNTFFCTTNSTRGAPCEWSQAPVFLSLR